MVGDERCRNGSEGLGIWRNFGIWRFFIQRSRSGVDAEVLLVERRLLQRLVISLVINKELRLVDL